MSTPESHDERDDLDLDSETVKDLEPDDATGVAGGGIPQSIITCVSERCPTVGCKGW
jgi:hypothetical protein